MDTQYNPSNKTARYFIINLSVIMVFGLIMVYSSSYMFAKENFGGANYFFFRQVLYCLLGIAVFYGVSRTRPSFWINYSFHFNFFITVLLFFTFIPGIGVSIKGSGRWIQILGSNIQPGEFVKYSLLVSSLHFFENFYSFSLKQKLSYLGLLLLPLVLLMLQPDYGSFTIGFLVISFVCYISNFSRKYFYTIISVGSVSGIGLLFTESYRISRLLTFLDPWKNPKTSGFQIIQSYLAFANGKLLGQGLGNSSEKLFYLPEAHNDFIFSVIGEELGFVGVLFVVGLVISALYLGLKLSFSMKKKWAMILSSSVMFIFGLQCLLNMGVVLGLLPTKGLNLPFISYGGSSLMANFLGMGLLFCSLRYCNEREELLATPGGHPVQRHHQ